ncbi:MAG: DUF3794 domain-containing protein [Clostridia bacterium]|nr:DUF3794 domain-containing protein [Clostridia bacterium]
MEEKCLKTSVFVNDTVYSESTEQAVDIDFTLPDYCPDISKIFKCQSVPRVSSKGINGKTVTVDGTVLLTLLYTDNQGNLCSYEYQYPFSKNIEMPNEHSGVNLFCKTRTEYINCRAVTGRKVDIHGAVGIFIKAFKRRSTEIISDIDDGNIELHRGIAPATVPMGYSEKYLMVEDELHIGQGQPSVRNILRCEAKSCVRETKVINDKAVVKGEMTVCVLYCPEGGGNPQNVKTVIPFSQIVDVDGITESCNCDTTSEIAFFEVKPRVSSTGETKMFSVTAKILLTCSATCGNEIAVVLDAFSRKFQAEATRNKVCFEKITTNISETYHCKKSVELEMPVESVLDLWCNVGPTSVKFEDGNMIICGTVTASMIVCGEKNNTFYCEKSVDFEYKYPVNNSTGTLHAEPEIEILSCGYTLTSPENMEVRIDLTVNAAVYERSEMSLISDFRIDESRPAVRKGRGAMVIYFPSEGECVWDIARNYNASVEEIMRINELETESVPQGKMILVPMI